MIQVVALSLMGHAATLDALQGVETPDISLNGAWHFQLPAPVGFWKEPAVSAGWKAMPVPGDVFREGHLIKEDEPFAYKRKVLIPADYAGQQIRLRFEGAHEYARVWVNATYITEHQGGWTPWECEITAAVTPGEEAWIAVELTDLKKDIAFNGKRLRAIGGLVRSVTLQARPKTMFEFPIVSSPFAENGRDATLTVVGQVASPDPQASASFRLFDPAGQEVNISPARCVLDQAQVTWTALVKSPETWDAEHPRLYRLEITSKAPNQAEAVYSRQIGLRDIGFDDKKNLLINGKVVKLRGANRHLVNPLRGFVPDEEIDRRDAELFKEANMNFVRTSHYPPGIGFAEQCDRSGIYMILESAVLDVGKKNRPSKGMHDDPKYEHLFVNQLREMVLNYGSHPAIILWSTCNESLYGKNMQASYDFVHAQDPTRPVIASYQVVEDPEHKSYDVKSSHYPRWDRDYEVTTMPTIYDEWMHVLGHTAQEWRHDPNSRDYWGRSLDEAWSRLFPANGSVGAAIWNFVDDMTIQTDPTQKSARGATRRMNPETAKLVVTGNPSNITGTARWGIIDEWRRPKPEFWNVKKAYSPARLLKTAVRDADPAAPISLPIHNRYDHTSLDEITLVMSYEGKTVRLPCPSIPPHQKGAIELPAADWKAGTTVDLSFVDAAGRLVDRYVITLGEVADPVAPAVSRTPEVTEEDGKILVQGDAFCFVVNRESGLIQRIEHDAEVMKLTGPLPHIVKLEEYLYEGVNPAIGAGLKTVMPKTVSYDSPLFKAWKKTSIRIEEKDQSVEIHVAGRLDAMEVTYIYILGANGRFDIAYHFDKIPPLVVENKKRDRGGPLNLEVGIKFLASDQFDRSSWDKQAYWSTYPEGHIGRSTGSIALFTTDKPEWAQKPDTPWAQDVWDFYFMGWGVPGGKLLTYEAYAAKQAIRTYTLEDTNASMALTVYGDGKTTTARFGQFSDQTYYLYLLDTLDYHLRWGNYSAEIRPSAQHQGVARLALKKGAE